MQASVCLLRGLGRAIQTPEPQTLPVTNGDDSSAYHKVSPRMSSPAPVCAWRAVNAPYCHPAETQPMDRSPWAPSSHTPSDREPGTRWSSSPAPGALSAWPAPS